MKPLHMWFNVNLQERLSSQLIKPLGKMYLLCYFLLKREAVVTEFKSLSLRQAFLDYKRNFLVKHTHWFFFYHFCSGSGCLGTNLWLCPLRSQPIATTEPQLAFLLHWPIASNCPPPMVPSPPLPALCPCLFPEAGFDLGVLLPRTNNDKPVGWWAEAVTLWE